MVLPKAEKRPEIFGGRNLCSDAAFITAQGLLLTAASEEAAGIERKKTKQNIAQIYASEQSAHYALLGYFWGRTKGQWPRLRRWARSPKAAIPLVPPPLLQLC